MEPAKDSANSDRPDGSGAGRTRQAFRRDVLWNFGSTVVLALGGFLLLALLGSLHGTSGLGIFAQVWAPYVIFSQLAVGGLDRSLLHSLARDFGGGPEARAERRAVVWGALLPAALSSSLCAALFYALRGPIADWYASPDVALGVAAAAPGLAAFGVNKVLLGMVNGLERMRAFAVYQSMRYVLMPLGVWVALEMGKPAAEAAFLFTFAEGVLLAVLGIELALQVGLPGGRWPAQVLGHLRYGLRSVASGVLLELNSRVDVWMLGRYLGDSAVGLYNAALQVAEGTFQLIVALQNNYNPVLAQLWRGKRREEFEQLVRSGGRRTFVLFGLFAALAVALYPWGMRILFRGDEFVASHAAFALLMAGIWLSSVRMPFFQVLLMSGRPGWHSLFMISVVAFNVLANAICIPRLGIEGAALATGLSFCASIVMLRGLVRRQLGWGF